MQSLSPPDFARCLADFRRYIGHYGWIWRILRMYSKPSGRWDQRFPMSVYAKLRRCFRRDRPYFIGRTADGTAFLGDCRDLYAVISVVLGDHDLLIVNFIKDRVRQRRGSYFDIGTNMGVVAASIARTFEGGGEVVAFQPHSNTARRAAATFALNQLENVRLFEVAV